MRMIHFFLKQTIEKNPFWRDDLCDYLHDYREEAIRKSAGGSRMTLRQRICLIFACLRARFMP